MTNTATLELDVRQNRADLNTLTNQVTKIATIVEGAEKRHENDVQMWRETIQSINKLTDGVNKTLLLEKDVSALYKEDARLDSEVRIVKHDLGEMKNSQQLLLAIPGMQVKIDSLETSRDKAIGGGIAIERMGKIGWTVLISVIGGIGMIAGWAISIFF